MQYLDESSGVTQRRSDSNDTARLSFSKDERVLNNNPIPTYSSQDKR